MQKTFSPHNEGPNAIVALQPRSSSIMLLKKSHHVPRPDWLVQHQALDHNQPLTNQKPPPPTTKDDPTSVERLALAWDGYNSPNFERHDIGSRLHNKKE